VPAAPPDMLTPHASRFAHGDEARLAGTAPWTKNPTQSPLESEDLQDRLRRTLEETQRLRDGLQRERIHLREEARLDRVLEEIVGASGALQAVFAQVNQVAMTDCPVLLAGETGTGKELIARRIHERSRRRDRRLVTVNCAALPAGLVESELFGYDKGAFTGALKSTLGRFEVADGGTILLDEIGELPLETQPKLLRVLQSGEFQRLGGARTARVDTRIIASTNRDLACEVSEGRFRADLYYRLSVFPITLPALRERAADIPLLVWHFITRKQAQLGKTIKQVPDAFMRALQAYSWPGNVRELENVIERALIMTQGSTLASDWLGLAGAVPRPAVTSSLEDVERQHISAVLVACGWKVAGKGNAAERLGLSRSTLQFRMKKLRIERPVKVV
jgi:formate hydrogenlyase transcriptional activator